jgi:hypothetical protein
MALVVGDPAHEFIRLALGEIRADAHRILAGDIGDVVDGLDIIRDAGIFRRIDLPSGVP